MTLKKRQTKKLYLDHAYASHENYPGHYGPNQKRNQTFETGSDMFFVIHFIDLQLERGTRKHARIGLSSPIPDPEEPEKLLRERYCGDINGMMFIDQKIDGTRRATPTAFNRKIYLTTNTFHLAFKSDAHGHYKGHLVRIESIPQSGSGKEVLLK